MLRIKNVLTKQEDTLEVPCEELLSEIRGRYLKINAHAHAYIWKAFLPAPPLKKGPGAAAGGGGGGGGAGGLQLRELDMNKSLQVLIRMLTHEIVMTREVVLRVCPSSRAGAQRAAQRSWRTKKISNVASTSTL